MAGSDKPEAGNSTGNTYAAGAVETKPIAEAPVEFPSKAKREPKPRPPAKAPVAAPAVEPATVAAKPVPSAGPVPGQAKPAPARITHPPISDEQAAPIAEPEISQLKEDIMATQTTDFTTSPADKFGGFKDVFTDVKSKAKAAFDKGASSLGDATDFAKGNVEAFVESGKIYAAGLQELGSTYAAESKTAFETLTADVKDLAAQKTPTDFFKLQSELAKKNFESAVAFGTKSSEAWLKLANDAFAPISGRVSLAVEKIKTAA